MARFGEISDEELKQLLENKSSEETKRATGTAYRTFSKYLLEKRWNIDLETVEIDALDAILGKFYVDARKEDGDYYRKNSFHSIRYGLQRKFKEIRDIDIVNDGAFRKSTEFFEAQLVFLKKNGYGKVEHKPPVIPEDVILLYTSGIFDTTKPRTLQYKVFF